MVTIMLQNIDLCLVDRSKTSIRIHLGELQVRIRLAQEILPERMWRETKYVQSPHRVKYTHMSLSKQHDHSKFVAVVVVERED